MGKFNFNESPVKKVAEDIRDNQPATNGYGMTEADAEQFVSGGQQQQGRGVAQPVTPTPSPTIPQPIPEVNQQMQSQAQAATIVTAQGRKIPLGGPLVFNEPTKGISVKLPNSLYDALDAIKKHTQRTGNPRDKMGLGDLVVLAINEFVNPNGVG